MGFEILISAFLIASYQLYFGNGQMTLSIRDFLSDSNNTNVDHSQAFQNAWKALCGGKGKGGAASLVIHASETYTIRPQLFQGPCVSRNIYIQIDGKIEASTMARDWGSPKSESWLCFSRVTGLVLKGSGLLHSHGEHWWSSVGSRPQAVRFAGCQNILYNGLTQMNSPRNHITIVDCTNVTISNIHLIAPANSPNTDGIDITSSHNINILSSTIKTGDDCVAIKGGSYDINVTYVACGPGHGISVGSLGKAGANDMVQNVNVKHCTFSGTHNGARIKTWPGGRGFAKNILYEDITLINAQFPIIVDQHYCSGGHCQPVTKDTAVKVSDVTFKSFKGTCADAVAIKLDCDRKSSCNNIVMDHINITPSSPKTPLTSYCKFAQVISRFVSINIKCDFHQDPDQPLSPSPQLPSPYAQSPTPHAQSPTPHAQPPAPTAQSPLLFPFMHVFQGFLLKF